MCAWLHVLCRGALRLFGIVTIFVCLVCLLLGVGVCMVACVAYSDSDAWCVVQFLTSNVSNFKRLTSSSRPLQRTTTRTALRTQTR